MTATTGVWSPTRIASIAPDDRVAAAGLKLSATGAWTGLGRSENLLWGQYRSSGGTTCQVHADLSEPAFRCSCSSEKFPCKHVIGLLHLWRDGRVDEEEPTNVVRTQQGENGTGGTDEAAAGTASAVAGAASVTGATDTTGAAARDDGAPADQRGYDIGLEHPQRPGRGNDPSPVLAVAGHDPPALMGQAARLLLAEHRPDEFGRAAHGRVVGVDERARQDAGHGPAGEGIPERLGDPQADHALGLGDQGVERIDVGGQVRVGRRRGQQAHLGAVAVGDHELVLGGEGLEGGHGEADLGDLDRRVRGGPAGQEGVTAESEDDAHWVLGLSGDRGGSSDGGRPGRPGLTTPEPHTVVRRRIR